MCQAQAAIRSLFSLVFFFLFFIASAQISESDTAYLQSASRNILNRTVDFTWQGGLLSGLLDKLGKDQDLNISFSADVLGETYAGEKSFAETPLSRALENSFAGTGFSYIMVGRIIVVVKDEVAVNDEIPEDSTSASVSDSLAADTASASKPNAAPHIYSPSNSHIELTPELKRKLSQLYREELQWAARKKRMENSSGKADTVSRQQPKPVCRDPELSGADYYLSATAGISFLKPRFKNHSGLDWENDLSFDPENTGHFDLGGGLVLGRFLAGAGFGFQRSRFQGTLIKSKPPGNPGQGQGVKDSVFSFSQEFRIISVPVEAFYYSQRGSLFVAAGPALTINFVKTELVQLDKLEEYYEDKEKDVSFFEEAAGLSMSISLNLLAGYRLSQKWVLLAGASYSRSLSPVYENSLYKVYPDAFYLQASAVYLLKRRR